LQQYDRPSNAVELHDEIRAAILPLIALLSDDEICEAAVKALRSFAIHGKLHTTIAAI